MANIGATTAFYKVETSLTRANNEVSKSMERLATGKQNANAGDRSSYAAMADTFRLDYVGTKAGIKGASVAMGYLELMGTTHAKVASSKKSMKPTHCSASRVVLCKPSLELTLIQ